MNADEFAGMLRDMVSPDGALMSVKIVVHRDNGAEVEATLRYDEIWKAFLYVREGWRKRAEAELAAGGEP